MQITRIVLIIISCTTCFAVLGCDREAIISAQAESIQINVAVTPSVVDYGEPFTIKIEVMNWTNEPFIVYCCGLPYDYCIEDETGYCAGGIGIGCIPGSDLNVYEFPSFSMTEFIASSACGVPYPCLEPGRYMVKARIAGIFTSVADGKCSGEAVLVVQ